MQQHGRTRERHAGLAAALCGLVVLGALAPRAAASSASDDEDEDATTASPFGVLDAQPGCTSDPPPPAPPWNDNDTVHALPPTGISSVPVAPTIALAAAGAPDLVDRGERLSFAPKTSPPR